MSVGSLTFSVGATIVQDNKASDIELAVSNVRDFLKGRSQNDIDSILNAVHMQGNGKRELGLDKNRRFRKFWIALEALINMDGSKRDIAQRIENALIQLYETNDPGKKYRMKPGFEIKLIKDDRIGQFHYARENPERVTELERILDDLIRSRVGLCHRGYARDYLEVIT